MFLEHPLNFSLSYNNESSLNKIMRHFETPKYIEFLK